MFRTSRLCGDFNSLGVLRSFSCVFTHCRGVKVIKGGNAKGSAFVGVLVKRIRPSDNALSVKRAMHFKCCSRSKLRFSRRVGIVSIIRSVTRIVRLNGNGGLATSRFLRRFLFAPRARRDCMCGLDKKRHHQLCLYAILVHGPGFLMLSRPAGSLSVVALGILRRCLRGFGKYIVIISRSHCFVSGIISRLLMFGKRKSVHSFPNGCDSCHS